MFAFPVVIKHNFAITKIPGHLPSHRKLGKLETRYTDKICIELQGYNDFSGNVCSEKKLPKIQVKILADTRQACYT